MLYKALNKAIVPALSKVIGRMPREVAIPNILDNLGTFIPPTLWTRTGSRFDIHDLGIELGANNADLFCRGTRQTSGIVDAATALNADQIDQYDTPQGVTIVGDMMTEGAGAGNHRVGHAASITTLPIAINIKVRRSVGTRNIGFYKNTQLGIERFSIDLGDGSAYGIVGSPTIGSITLVDGWWHIHGLLNSVANQFMYIAMDDGSGTLSYTGDGVSSIEIERVATAAGGDVPAFFALNSAAGATYGADLATAENAFDGGPINRSLITAIKNYTTGVVTSIDSIAPTTGDHVFDGTTDGNTERISWLSDAVITAGEITQAKAALEAVFNVDAGNCSFYALNETTGLPMWVVGTGIPFTAP